jgi:hypothetical protein
MTSIEFIKKIREKAIENHLQLYKSMLDKDVITNKDPIREIMLNIHNRLSEDEKSVFLKFLRLVEVNSVAYILGILDNTVLINNNSKELFKLTTTFSDELINEDLLDKFWEIEEIEN